MYHELLTLWTGLLPPAGSPIQKMVVTMRVFHGYFPETPTVRVLVGMSTCGSMLRMALSRSFAAYFAKSELLT